MSKRHFFGGAILLLFFGCHPCFAQFVCANDFYGYPKTFVPTAGCVIFATVAAFDPAVGNYAPVQPQLYENNFIQTLTLSGAMGGDLGNICTTQACAKPVTSFPCQSFAIGPNYKNGPLAIATAFTPGIHVITASFTTCTTPVQSWSGTIMINAIARQTTPTSCTPSLIDPVIAALLRTTTTGTYITTDRQSLQTASTGPGVAGVSADGVAEVVVSIPANRGGDSLSLSVTNGRGSIDDDGGLLDVTAQGASFSTTVNLIASGSPPMGFAIYRAPKNFSGTGKDDSSVNRHVTLQVSCPDVSGSLTTTSTSVLIVRPPVELVHGIWSDASTWNNFLPLASPDPSVGDARFFVRRTNFSQILNGITASVPSYDSGTLQRIDQSSLGFAYNASLVLLKLHSDILDFKRTFNVAAVQADVVGHSMGGVVARTMATLPTFYDDTYASGPIHKLITIGTPHLGTPLATQLLPQGTQDINPCFRGLLAGQPEISLQSVVLQGVSVNGAVGDLQGDGSGGSLSPALASLQSSHPFPVAYIAGTANQTNLSGLDCLNCWSNLIRVACTNDPLAQKLNSQQWSTIFGQSNDAIVPLSSELNGLSGAMTADGLIHSSAIESLGFGGPAELDSLTGILGEVDYLLNESVSGSDFHP